MNMRAYTIRDKHGRVPGWTRVVRTAMEGAAMVVEDGGISRLG